MELEVSQQIGAIKHAHASGVRTIRRNGTRSRLLKTRVGEISLRIPKLREGSYYPSMLTPNKRAEEALISVVAEAYVQGVSTRKMQQVAETMRIGRLSKSKVSRLYDTLDIQVQTLKQRPLAGSYPYVWLDATYLEV